MNKKPSLLIIFFLLLIIMSFSVFFDIHRWIILSADDLCHSLKSVSFLSAFMNSYYDYFGWSGRFFVNILASLSARYPLWWKFINSFLIVLTACLMIKISSFYGFFTRRNIVLFILLTSVLVSLDINLAIESIYWISGSVGYLWPVALTLSFLCLWIYSISNADTKQNKYIKFLLLVLSIFVGSSNEQCGVLSIIFMLGYGINFWINKSRIPSFFSILIFTTLILSYLTLILAPGNVARSISQVDGTPLYYSSDVLSKVTLRLHEILSLLQGIKSFIIGELLLIISIFVKLITKGNKEVGHTRSTSFYIILVAPFTYLLFVQLGNIQGWWNISSFLLSYPQINKSLTFSGAISYLIFLSAYLTIGMYSLNEYKFKKDPRLLLFLISMVVSQAIMLFAPTSTYRTFFVTNIFLWSSVLYLINTIDNKFAISVINVIIFILILSSIKDYQVLSNNLRSNYLFNLKNENMINDYLQSKKFDSLILYKLPYENYSFDMPYPEDNKYKELSYKCFKEYYGIDASTNIIWQSNFK